MTDTKQQTILIVDDEEIIRDLLAEVLEDYVISLACDGREAIDKLKESKYDLVITDLRMPNVPGEEVVKFARETYPGTRVIVISAYSSLHTVETALEEAS